MSITYTEIKAARSSTQTRDWKRAYTRAFRAIADDYRYGPGTVRAGLADEAGHPIRIGSLYQLYDAFGTKWEQDLGCFAATIAAAEDPASDDGTQWIVTVEYTPYDATTFPQNPIDWPLKISWSNARYERAADRDLISNQAIVNAAGDAFDPPAAIDDSRWVLRVVKNQPKFDPAWADKYKDATNSDPFFNAIPQTWKILSITSGDPIHDTDCQTADGWYYSVTYEMEYNPGTWVLDILNQGVRQKVAGQLEQIFDDKGTPVSSPVLLDSAGAKLATGGTPVFLPFSVYKQVAFADLQLDPSTAPTWNN